MLKHTLPYIYMMKQKLCSADLAWKKLQNLLARRDHSPAELMKKLQIFGKQEAITAIEKAQQKKWIQKPEQLTAKIVEELNRKKKGWLYIKMALKKRGLPLTPKDPQAEKQKALYWLLKKWPTPVADQSPSLKTKASMSRFLSVRGFENTDIQQVIQDYFSRP